MADRTADTGRLGRARTAPAGRAARARLRWSRRVAGALFAVAALALAFAAVRPLPSVHDADVAAVPDAPPPTLERRDLDARRDVLASLERGGNVFASGREPWPEQRPADAVAQAEEPEPEPAPAPAPTGDRDERPDPASIKLTERPTVASQRSRDELSLRGLLAHDDDRIAMIAGGERGDRDATYLYREGAVFGDETWRLLAVDPRRDRVILEHLGQGDVVELTLYEQAPTLASASEETPEPETPAVPKVERRTIAEARTDLSRAGIPTEEIDRVVRIMEAMERGEPIDEATLLAEAGAAPESPADADASGESEDGAPPMPSQLRALLESMARDANRRSDDGGG